MLIRRKAQFTKVRTLLINHGYTEYRAPEVEHRGSIRDAWHQEPGPLRRVQDFCKFIVSSFGSVREASIQLGFARELKSILARPSRWAVWNMEPDRAKPCSQLDMGLASEQGRLNLFYSSERGQRGHCKEPEG